MRLLRLSGWGGLGRFSAGALPMSILVPRFVFLPCKVPKISQLADTCICPVKGLRLPHRTLVSVSKVYTVEQDKMSQTPWSSSFPQRQDLKDDRDARHPCD
ncbi:hypothetical protein [Bacteroides zoogleoformans]|uniref:hypothetical protein n=1 Tax=Bacteroides zoogleoformans TaxID=28119 RepID=UPI00248E5567|nr:hypothetical protein [Bacteroides zoogleoformans]